MPSDAALRVVQDAFVIGESGVKSAIAKAEISFEQAQSGLKMVVAAMHLEKAGLIRYTANSPALLALAKKVLEYAKQ